MPAFCREDTPNQPNWKDIAPRMAVVYDVFGNAQTALKGSVSNTCCRGLVAGRSATTHSRPRPTPARGRIATVTTSLRTRNRSEWQRQLRRVHRAHTDANLRREYNIETALGVQHQLLPRPRSSRGTFHRHFYNQEAQKNPLLTAADWTAFQVANPPATANRSRSSTSEPGEGHQLRQPADRRELRHQPLDLRRLRG